MAESTLDALRREEARLRGELDTIQEEEPPEDPKQLPSWRRRLRELTDDYRQTLNSIARLEREQTPSAKKEPETITRSRPSPRGDGPDETEVVSKAQADYERQVEQDAFTRQQSIATDRRADERLRMEQAKAAEAKLADDLANKVAQGQLDQQRAIAQWNAGVEKIRLSLSAANLEATQRGQDISARGQDVQARVTQRGQDLDYETTLAGYGTDAALSATKALWLPDSQRAQLDMLIGAIAGGNRGPLTLPQTVAEPLPYDFATLPQTLAQQARAQAPAQLALPALPTRVATPDTAVPELRLPELPG